MDLSNIEIDFTVTLRNLTVQADYEIFDSIYNNNMSRTLTFIEEHKGVNALDDHGYSTLMVAVKMELDVVSGVLINTWSPKVNVNAVTHGGFSALHFAATKKGTSILVALLKRGADPNKRIISPYTNYQW